MSTAEIAIPAPRTRSRSVGPLATLARRRFQLTARTPRELVVPLLTPIIVLVDDCRNTLIVAIARINHRDAAAANGHCNNAVFQQGLDRLKLDDFLGQR